MTSPAKRISDLPAAASTSNAAFEVSQAGTSKKMPIALSGLVARNWVISRAFATPPATPAEGDRYLVAANGTGAWSGLDGYVVEWMLVDSVGSWRAKKPTGTLYIIAEQALQGFTQLGTPANINYVDLTKAQVDFSNVSPIDFGNFTFQVGVNTDTLAYQLLGGGIAIPRAIRGGGVTGGKLIDVLRAVKNSGTPTQALFGGGDVLLDEAIPKSEFTGGFEDFVLGVCDDNDGNVRSIMKGIGSGVCRFLATGITSNVATLNKTKLVDWRGFRVECGKQTEGYGLGQISKDANDPVSGTYFEDLVVAGSQGSAFYGNGNIYKPRGWRLRVEYNKGEYANEFSSFVSPNEPSNSLNKLRPYGGRFRDIEVYNSPSAGFNRAGCVNFLVDGLECIWDLPELFWNGLAADRRGNQSIRNVTRNLRAVGWGRVVRAVDSYDDMVDGVIAEDTCNNLVLLARKDQGDDGITVKNVRGRNNNRRFAAGVFQKINAEDDDGTADAGVAVYLPSGDYQSLSDVKPSSDIFQPGPGTATTNFDEIIVENNVNVGGKIGCLDVYANSAPNSLIGDGTGANLVGHLIAVDARISGATGVLNEQHTIVAGLVTVTFAGAGVYKGNFSVRDETTGAAYTLVTGAPASGQYSVITSGVNAGKYTFNTADNGKAPKFSYAKQLDNNSCQRGQLDGNALTPLTAQPWTCRLPGRGFETDLFATIVGEIHTIPATAPFIIDVTNAATFSLDGGVMFIAPGTGTISTTEGSKAVTSLNGALGGKKLGDNLFDDDDTFLGQLEVVSNNNSGTLAQDATATYSGSYSFGQTLSQVPRASDVSIGEYHANQLTGRYTMAEADAGKRVTHSYNAATPTISTVSNNPTVTGIGTNFTSQISPSTLAAGYVMMIPAGPRFAGGGTIVAASTTSKNITSPNGAFANSKHGQNAYTAAGVLVGVIDTVTTSNAAVLVDNAAVIYSGAWKYGINYPTLLGAVLQTQYAGAGTIITHSNSPNFEGANMTDLASGKTAYKPSGGRLGTVDHMVDLTSGVFTTDGADDFGSNAYIYADPLKLTLSTNARYTYSGRAQFGVLRKTQYSFQTEAGVVAADLDPNNGNRGRGHWGSEFNIAPGTVNPPRYDFVDQYGRLIPHPSTIANKIAPSLAGAEAFLTDGENGRGTQVYDTGTSYVALGRRQVKSLTGGDGIGGPGSGSDANLTYTYLVDASIWHDRTTLNADRKVTLLNTGLDDKASAEFTLSRLGQTNGNGHVRNVYQADGVTLIATVADGQSASFAFDGLQAKWFRTA